jgi:hypothetical protein
LAVVLCLAALCAHAETLRLGVWHEALSRDGPGLLLRDLQRGEPELVALADLVRLADPDVLVLTKIDFDASGLAARAFAELISPKAYPFVMALRSNEGVPTGIDMDGDRRGREPEDAHGYGVFPGQGALAVLSRLPIREDAAVSYNDILWSALPGTHMLPSDPGYDVQKVSSGGHWRVLLELSTPQGREVTLWLLVGHSGPPVFDGPEDRNGRRNLDELRLWSQILEGQHGPAPGTHTVFAANTNLDPNAGEGYRDAMQGFLDNGRFQDPLPDLPTAYWEKLDPMRVSYLLPSTTIDLLDVRRWPRREGMTHHLLTIDIHVPGPVEP